MMAFSGMIIKTSSRQCVVPLARYAIDTSRILNTTMFGSDCQLRNFCSTVADNKDSVDANLFKALKSEYNLSKIMLKHSQVNIPMGSFPFKLYDSINLGKSGWRREGSGRECRFKREFPDGEKVIVSVEDNKAPPTHMTVNVGKSDFEFKITASTENIVIESIYYRADSYKRLKFEELDNEFQQALIEYLNVRGINRDTITIFLDLVAKENQKADLVALKHFKKVVNKLLW